MFQRCLICTNFTDGLHRLCNFVPSLAQGGLKRIVFAHSVPLWEEGNIPRVDTQEIDRAKALLANALKNIPPGLEVHLEVPSGKPTENLLKLIKQYDIEMMLLGTSIRPQVQEKVFGSITQGLLRSLSIPLMILRPQLINTYTRAELALRSQNLWEYLLIPYYDGEAGHYLIEQIQERLAKYSDHRPKGCYLVTVVSDGGRREVPIKYRLEEAQQHLGEAKTQLEGFGLTVQTQVRSGNLLQEILAAALEMEVSAIAVSHLQRSTLLELTVQSIASEILHQSWFPVLFFPPKS